MSQISPGGGGAHSLVLCPSPQQHRTTARFKNFYVPRTFLNPSQIHKRNNTTGFTLVELIVVIVILGILLAIAIPALTGYITKAQDEKYKTEARDTVVAVRTVLDVAYSKGELTSSTTHPDISNYVQNGVYGSGVGFKMFPLELLSVSATGSVATYSNAAVDLMSKGRQVPISSGYWTCSLVGRQSSDSTALNADGFLYTFYPDGNGGGLPAIIVTYRLNSFASGLATLGSTHSAFNTLIASGAASYSADVDYMVYRFAS
jgi:prepilin-type N-terminal cleavage/methylation domain-containing protein